ncbi:hypothetical protein Salmuc_01949 [Salipiger mucosus DSM 16094]|uniref:Uncharacterized protein n=1 Tax=Salipiger mucosus DSM 16094 TaxID=1123237 RepID=S9Q4B3_9RHOB|nr:hypothetical protein Salmuc_01949 [Salipiger mucosus DSM 16094]
MTVHGREACEPGPVKFEDAVPGPGHSVAGQGLEDDVLGRNPVGQGAGDLDPPEPGIGMQSGSRVMASATSIPPAPMASIPSEPAPVVWLSEPTRLWPGTPKHSMCTGCEIPLPGPE